MALGAEEKYRAEIARAAIATARRAKDPERERVAREAYALIKRERLNRQLAELVARTPEQAS